MARIQNTYYILLKQGKDFLSKKTFMIKMAFLKVVSNNPKKLFQIELNRENSSHMLKIYEDNIRVTICWVFFNWL